MYRNNAKILLQQPQRIFHTQDLAVLWGIAKPNTLYTTIKRYRQRHILHPVYKGLYSTLPPQNLDRRLLGLKVLHGFSYISCETILAEAGILNMVNSNITLISNQSKRFTIQDQGYHSRKLHDRFLHNSIGIEYVDQIRQATVTRAIADMLYFNPLMHFDAPIDWESVWHYQSMIGYPITKRKL